jgi:hypothetical protein
MSVLLNLGLNTLLNYVILMADRNNVTFVSFERDMKYTAKNWWIYNILILSKS